MRSPAIAYDRAAGIPLQVDLDLLPVGVTTRGRTRGYEAPYKVRTADDLPPRLYLGSLATDSFRISDSGWTARYVDATPDTSVDLEFRASPGSWGSLTARLTWSGIQDLTIVARDWTTLGRYMAFEFPETWEREAKQRLETAFNLRLLTRPHDAPLMSGFPDGPAQSVVFPVPSDRLHALTGCLDAIDADADIAAAVTMFVTMARSRVDYIEGRCSDVPNAPPALAEHSRDSVGLACDGMPKVQVIENGLRALTVKRWVFLAHVVCTFRDLARVVSACSRHGFIGVRDNAAAPSVYPDGREWSAVALPVGCGTGNTGVCFFDEEQTRRLTYEQLLPPDRLQSLAGLRDVSREEGSRRLAAAQAWARSEPDVV